MGSSGNIVSNKNNRNLQRTGNSAYKSRKGEFLGRNVPRSDKPVHEQYSYTDRTAPLWQRLAVLAFCLALLAILITVLANYPFLDAGRLVD